MSIICHTSARVEVQAEVLVGDRREHRAPDRRRVGEVVAARPLVVGEDHRAVLDRDLHAVLAGVVRRAAATPRGSARGSPAGCAWVAADERADGLDAELRRRLDHLAQVRVRGRARLVVRDERVRVVGERGDLEAAALQAGDDLGRLRRRARRRRCGRRRRSGARRPRRPASTRPRARRSRWPPPSRRSRRASASGRPRSAGRASSAPPGARGSTVTHRRSRARGDRVADQRPRRGRRRTSGSRARRGGPPGRDGAVDRAVELAERVGEALGVAAGSAACRPPRAQQRRVAQQQLVGPVAVAEPQLLRALASSRRARSRRRRPRSSARSCGPARDLRDGASTAAGAALEAQQDAGRVLGLHRRVDRLAAAARAENVSTGPVGRRRTGMKVVRSAITASTRRPVTYCTRSIQCEPMSPTARSAPPSAGSSRQFQSVSKSSQSWR